MKKFLNHEFYEPVAEDVPEPPQSIRVYCEGSTAIVYFGSRGYNRSSILRYAIEKKSSSSEWEFAKFVYDPDSTNARVDIDQYENTKFRVIAYNGIGASPPSDESETCTWTVVTESSQLDSRYGGFTENWKGQFERTHLKSMNIANLNTSFQILTFQYRP